MSKKIRFLEDKTVFAIVDTCCYSGEYHTEKMKFKKDDVLEVSDVVNHPKIKVKTRPGVDKRDYQKTTVFLLNKNSATTHPDYFIVRQCDIEVID